MVFVLANASLAAAARRADAASGNRGSGCRARGAGRTRRYAVCGDPAGPKNLVTSRMASPFAGTYEIDDPNDTKPRIEVELIY